MTQVRGKATLVFRTKRRELWNSRVSKNFFHFCNDSLLFYLFSLRLVPDNRFFFPIARLIRNRVYRWLSGDLRIWYNFTMEIKLDGAEGSLVLIKQGAEARVFESTFVGRRSIIKERFSKKYRHPSLDSKLTLKRLNAEARCMTKARKLGVLTPVLYAVDPMQHTLTFEFVEGPAIKDILLNFGSQGIIEERLDDIATQIGDSIGKLHDGGLIHGDLTTSNMLIQNDTNQLVLIDFGLGFTSTLPEDKAVDLYVLERALLSMHSSCGNVMDRILNGYRKSSKQWSSTLNKLAQVRQRGRKRTMVG